MEGRIGPVGNTANIAVFNGIVVNIIDMFFHIAIITQRVLPESTLPDSALSLIYRPGDRHSPAGTQRENRALISRHRKE